jgi:hypothetical protein
MDGKSHRSGRYHTASTSLWPGVVKPKEIAMLYIQLIRSKCPSLQYVQMDTVAWQIVSPQPGVLVAEADVNIKIVLRELEWEERMDIELFSLHTFYGQAGLPAPDDYHEEVSEEK